MALNGHVLASAEATTAGYLGNADLVLVKFKQRADLFLVNINTLPLAIEMNAVRFREGNRRLGLEESMLDALGLVDPGGGPG